MPSPFIDKLGRDYFSQRWRGCYFLYEDVVLRFSESTRDDCVACTNTEGDGNLTRVPNEFFSGFSVLKYPSLGYRVCGRTSLAAYITRATTYQPGIRDDNINIEATPFSLYVQDLDPTVRMTRSEAAEKIFKPSFHTPPDLQRLFDSEIAAYVPNESVCIEPSCGDEDGFSVLFRNNLIGRIDTDKEVQATNSKNLAFIRKVISV